MKKSILVLFIAVLAFTAYANSNKIINDAVFAVKGEKVYSPSFTGSFILYMIAPDRLAGWSGRLRDNIEKPNIPQKYQDLPVLGGWWQDDIVDKELVLKHKVKKAFVIDDPAKPDPRVEDLKKLGMDVLIIPAEKTDDYIPLLRALGRQMGITERGEELAAFGEEMLAKTRAMVRDVPEDKKPSVYSGRGPTGLSGMCGLDVLKIAGGKNILNCPFGTNQQLSIEQLMALNPDIILIANPDGRVVLNDPRWHRLRAYKEGKLFVVPFGPFGWMHSPEIGRFISVPWIACKLYPDKCTFDLEAETKRFYKLFLRMDLSDTHLNTILYRYGK